MTRDRAYARFPAGWFGATVIATLAMLGWLIWHAGSTVVTLDQMQASHSQAALLHDRLLRLESELQRTIQVGIAVGEAHHLSQHLAAERALRRAIEDLLANRTRDEERAPLNDALAAIDELSRIEDRALALQRSGDTDSALALVTGPAYVDQLSALTEALQRFDDTYHRWGLNQSVGLTQQEVLSLTGAFLLFAVVIGAWVTLIFRLQRERGSLVREIQRRNAAEAQLLHAQKNELLGQLAGGIAHDVDNILSAAAGYTGLARRAAEPGSRQLALDGLDKAVAQGRGLTRNLLSFTRQETSARRPVELGQLIRDTQSWLGALLPANIGLEVQGNEAGGLWVEADPVQLQQAFANVALNARDAMPEGGTLRVSLCRRPPEALGETAARAEWTACLSVTDTGIGMDPDTLERACEPLFTTKPAGQGTGLGLPAVVRIIESHGGRVMIDSRPGEGTHVRLLLPAASRPAAHPADVPRDTQPERKAVVVCQDPYSLELLVAALEDAGLEVAGVASLEEPGIGRGQPDVIVVDWQGDDAGALAFVRSLLAHRDAPPVILVADITDAAVQSELAELVMLVARPAPLGELGALASRLAAHRPSTAPA